jgi:hypothetical protein
MVSVVSSENREKGGDGNVSGIVVGLILDHPERLP